MRWNPHGIIKKMELCCLFSILSTFLQRKKIMWKRKLTYKWNLENRFANQISSWVLASKIFLDKSDWELLLMISRMLHNKIMVMHSTDFCQTVQNHKTWIQLIPTSNQKISQYWLLTVELRMSDIWTTSTNCALPNLKTCGNF